MRMRRISIAIVLLGLVGPFGGAHGQSLTTLHEFNGADGSTPPGLTQGSDGNFYGVTYYGGTSTNCEGGCGTVFRITPAGMFTTLYNFDSGNPLDLVNNPGAFTTGDNAFPQWLIQGSDGFFYGTASLGGTNGLGTVFRLNPDASSGMTNLWQFGAPGDGIFPYRLVQGSDGNFYGTTQYGGTGSNCYFLSFSGCGTVFQITPSGAYTTLHDFGVTNNDGSLPRGVIQGPGGVFYGTADLGGTSKNCLGICNGTNCFTGCGTVFSITTAGGFSMLHEFSSTDGSNPWADPVLGSDGNLYGAAQVGGMTSESGSFCCGSVYRISSQGAFSTLYPFCSLPDCADGDNPVWLIQGSDGNFYGTTESGGTHHGGTVFQLTPSGSLTTLYSFTGGSDGAFPQFLMQGSDGNFYGTTHLAGTHTNSDLNCSEGCGTIFKLVVGNGSGGGTNCAFSLGSTNAVFAAAGGSASISVTASNGCAWTATSNDPSFISITSGSSGSGNGTVQYGVAANTSSTPLTGTMTIAGQTFTVTQSGASAGNCTFTLSATSVTVPAKGGAKNVKVKVKGTGCNWTAVSNDPFITITSGSSGTGNGTVDYSVSGNTNTMPITGTMTIAGQTFTVNQKIGGCTITLSPKSAKVSAVGSILNVKVKANLSDCVWTAVSNDSFITITSGTSGTGNGTVVYSVAANTSTTPITGSMTIGGQTFTVTEAGAK